MSIVKYHIRNRASTVEIAPPTFEIALQHSKSRFNSRNRNSTFEIALRHSRRFEFRAESWRSVFVPGVSCAGNAQIPFKSSNYPRSSFRAESFLKIDFSRTQPEIQSASLHHSKSRFNIRNRTFTFEIAPPTFEITLQHSKSRFSIQNRASTLGITQQHSESHFQHQETRFQHAETPIQHSETPFQHSETPFQHSETPKVSNFVIQIVSILE